MKKALMIFISLLVIGTVMGCANEENQENVKMQTEELPEVTESSGEVIETVDDSSSDSNYIMQTPKELFIQFDEMFNSEMLDLTPRMGEFLTEDENYEIVESADGKWYGYEADYWGGCSVWCAISKFEEGATATSSLAPQGSNTYEARNIISHERGDAWVEGVEGAGIGESVSITKCYERDGEYGEWDCFFFPDLCIVNGLAKNEQSWKQNNRVKTLKMYFNEEYICDLELLDTMKPQYISLRGLHLSAQNSENCVFTFEISEVYKGDIYDDTAITGIEIELYTQNH